MWLRQRSFWIALVVAMVLMLNRWPSIYAAVLLNYTSRALSIVLPCDPTLPNCRAAQNTYPPVAWRGNVNDLTRIKYTLEQARRLDTDSQPIAVQLADVLFGLGDRQAAAALLPQLSIQLPSFQTTNLASAARSPLLTSGFYGSYLVAGHQRAAAGDWANAVLSYRLALMTGLDNWLPVDHTDYLMAVAHWHAQLATTGSDRGREAFLAGKYFTRSGAWDDAAHWLAQARSGENWAQLASGEKALTLMYVGEVAEAARDLSGAQVAYESSIQFGPQLVEPQARLLQLLLRLGNVTEAQQIASQLERRGPAYRPGRFAPGYAVPETTLLPNGWTLAGYDVDTESLENGGLLDLWLWWQAPDNTAPTVGAWIPIGKLWLQHVAAVNLAPNAGFEWGVESQTVPFGYWEEIYGAKPGSIALESTTRDDVPTTVTRMDNSQSRRVGMISRPVSVVSEGWYLMAGLKRDTGNANIGRLCEWPSAGGGPYYIAYNQPDQPPGVWMQFADLAQPIPGQAAERCYILLLNYETAGAAEFDNILLARLELPK